MKENKISVQEYLGNKTLLEVVYVPYEQKVIICDAILSQVAHKDGFATIDSVLLERVKTQIILENITNLDLSLISDDGLNGYDLLCFNNELDVLIDNNEFWHFNKIIELRLKDFYNENASLRGYINYLVNKVQNKAELFKEDLSEYIHNLDAKDIANKIIDVLPESIKEKI